jgi:hypothetical protein
VGLALIFSVFAVLGGAAALGAISMPSAVPGARLAATVAGAALAVRALRWHARRAGLFRLDRRTIQARRGRAGHGWAGTAYFGLVLGVTLLTEMATPAVQALAVLGIAAGPAFALTAGAGLGLARSVAPWRGALSAEDSPAVIVRRYAERRLTTAFMLTGLTVSAVLLLLAGACGLSIA